MRVFREYEPYAITDVDVSSGKHFFVVDFTTPLSPLLLAYPSLCLVACIDSRLSLWSCDVDSNRVEAVTRLSFDFNEKIDPRLCGLPTLAKFSLVETEVILVTSPYTKNQIVFYNFETKQVAVLRVQLLCW